MNNDLYIVINKTKKKINSSKQTNKVLEDKNIFITQVGTIYDFNNKQLELIDIKYLYNKYKTNINNYIDGVYSLIIFDKNINKVFIYKDYFGSNHNIFYYSNDKEIVISNKLKKILINNKNNWTLDDQGINQFLYYGYIITNNTLVKNISKIPGKRNLEIDLIKDKIKLTKSKLSIKRIKVDKKLYDKTVSEVCYSYLNNYTNHINITISSGYDTNYILYNLRKKTKKKINAFCIGGVSGRNEIPSSKEICSKYNNIDFHEELVDSDAIKNYPEIIWALEGTVYESGIFLQYKLANILNKNRVKNIYLGEIADQVLNYELYSNIFLPIKKLSFKIVKKIIRLTTGIVRGPYKDAYDMSSYIILKKSGLLMNYFGINPNSPYARKKYMDVARGTVKFGDKTKEYHKKVIREILPNDISKELNKIGGTIDIKSLFTKDIKLNEIKSIVKTSKYYKEIKFKDKDYETDYYLKLLYIELFKKMFLEDIEKFYNCDFKDYKLNYFYNKIK